MLTSDSVYEYIKVTAKTDDSEKDALLPFCECAAASVLSKLKTGADSDDIRLLAAAGAIAYCDYAVMKNAAENSFGSFKAGDVTITGEGQQAVEALEKLKISAISAASPLLMDTQFHFGTL